MFRISCWNINQLLPIVHLNSTFNMFLYWIAWRLKCSTHSNLHWRIIFESKGVLDPFPDYIFWRTRNSVMSRDISASIYLPISMGWFNIQPILIVVYDNTISWKRNKNHRINSFPRKLFINDKVIQRIIWSWGSCFIFMNQGHLLADIWSVIWLVYMIKIIIEFYLIFGELKIYHECY